MAHIMYPRILIIAAGAALVVVGGWLYRNPKKLVPGWGLLNPENPGVQRLARFYATFFMFAGLMTCGALTVQLLFPPLTVVLGLAFAVAGTWFLRRRMRPTSGTLVETPTVGGPVAEQKLFNRHWKRTLTIFAALAVVFMVFMFAMLADSDVSKLAFATAQTNSTVRQRLGGPIKRGFFTSGNIEISGPSGQADLAIPISGPAGKATLYAVAKKSADVWRFDTIEVAFDGEAKRVSLLDASVESTQPSTR